MFYMFSVRFWCVGAVFCLALTQALWAQAPVEMTGPVPSVSSSYGPGDSTTLVYTITNNVPNKGFPIQVSGLSSPLSRVTVSNDCGNVLPSGPSSCNIGVLISPTETDAGPVAQTLQVNYQSRQPLRSSLSFIVTRANGVIASVGNNSRTSTQGIIWASQDHGQHWHQSLVTSFQSTFNEVSCTGKDPEVLCVAVGQNNDTDKAFLAATANSDRSWTIPSISVPTSSRFLNVSCTGEASDSVCIATGYSSSPSRPLVLRSTDRGQTWETVDITGSVPTQSQAMRVSCIGAGATAQCAMVTGADFVLITNDAGQTWLQRSVTGSTASTHYVDVSCAYDQSIPFCATVGYETTLGLSSSSVASSTSLTLNAWASENISGLTRLSELLAVDCAGSANRAICAAGGHHSDVALEPLAVSLTSDGTWSKVSVNGLSTTAGQFDQASCTEYATDVACGLVGRYDINEPLLGVSTDGASTWALAGFSGTSPSSGINYGVFCSMLSNTAMCVAVGAEGPVLTSSVLLTESLDILQPNTWVHVPIDEPSSSDGAKFKSVSGSGIG